MRRIALLIVFVGMVVLSGVRQAAASIKNTVTNLGTLGGIASEAFAINELGHVAGASNSVSDATHAYLYDTNMMDLGTLGGTNSFAYGMNSSGQIVGRSNTEDNAAMHAFVYSQGTMLDLGTLPGSTGSEAWGINDSGEIVGVSGQAFIYSNGVMEGLGTFGGTLSIGRDINNSGQVAGLSYLPGNAVQHAFLYSDGEMMDLGTLGGQRSAAAGINDLGDVAGWASTNDITSQAFLYSSGVMMNLGSIDDGAGGSEAFDVNNSGQVVGSSSSFDGVHAFLYSGGDMMDLNDLIAMDSGWNLVVARDINDSGQIIGFGGFNGETRAFLLTPIPEPILLLEVNTKKPFNVTLKGDLGQDVAINSYQITSDKGSLDPTGWNSLADQGFEGDYDGNGTIDGADLLQWQIDGGTPAQLAEWEAHYGNSGPGSGWEEGVVSANFLGENFLLGDSTIGAGSSIDLGEIFKKQPGNPALSEDWVFSFRTADGTILPGVVSYVSGVAATSAVPEPTTSALALAALCLAIGRRRAF